MKRFLCVLFLAMMVFSLSACGAPVEETAKTTPVIEEKYDENGNILMEPLYMGFNLWYYNSYTYGEDQKLLNVTRYTNEGVYLDEEKYIYRADGTLEKVECYWENLDFEIVLWQEKLYNENGVLYKIQNYENGEISDYYDFEYDARQRCVKEIHYDIQWNNGDYPQSYVEYTYDDAGNCVRKDDYDQHEERTCYYTYTHDSNGNVSVESIHRLIDGEEFISTTEFTYHSNGKVKDKVTTDKSSRREEVWDARGAMVFEKSYEREASGEWFLGSAVEYSAELKVFYTYLKDGRYKTESIKGNAAVASWMELAWYNPDGTLFCTNHEGEFYDPSGNKLATPPDVSAWDEAT